MTYSKIGNYKINPDDLESKSTHASALIACKLSHISSNCRGNSIIRWVVDRTQDSRFGLSRHPIFGESCSFKRRVFRTTCSIIFTTHSGWASWRSARPAFYGRTKSGTTSSDRLIIFLAFWSRGKTSDCYCLWFWDEVQYFANNEQNGNECDSCTLEFISRRGVWNESWMHLTSLAGFLKCGEVDY